MKILDYKTDIPVYDKAPFKDYFLHEKTGIFDIETTGLSPGKSRLILAGVMFPRGGYYLARQYFAESPAEERLLIPALVEDLISLQAVVTYNGYRFDLPFLLQRMEMLGLDPAPVLSLYNLDLYRIARHFSDIPRFVPNLKQKTLEDFLGLWVNREDEIDGGESVRLYYRFLQTKDKETRERILLHNRDDILQLGRLMKVIGKTKFHQAMSKYGFPFSGGLLDPVTLKKNMLKITGRQTGCPVDYVAVDGAGQYSRFNSRQRTLEISRELIRRGGLVFYDAAQEDLDLMRLKEEPAYVDGFMVLQTEGNTDYRALNKTAAALAERIKRDGLQKNSGAD